MLAPDIARDLESRLQTELGFKLDSVRLVEVDPGVVHNNRLFRLRATDGREAMAKVYLRDDRQRLDREFKGLTLLRRRGFRSVPEPYLRNDEHNYGVYSMEPGENRPALRWTEADAVAAAEFSVELHRIRPVDVETPMPMAIFAASSYTETVRHIRTRLQHLMDYRARGDLAPEVRALYAETDPVAEVERLIVLTTLSIGGDEMDRRTPEREWCLNVGDFSPHNMLIRPNGWPNAWPDGRLCVLDLEYCGWDDPVVMPALFVTADQCLGMAAEHKETFLRVYRDAAGLTPEHVNRMERRLTLLHVSWCAVHLQLLTPPFIVKKQFATPNMDVAAHLSAQIAKFKHRLQMAHEAIRLH